MTHVTYNVLVRQTTYQYTTVPVTVELEDDEEPDFGVIAQTAEDIFGATSDVDWDSTDYEIEAFQVLDTDSSILREFG